MPLLAIAAVFIGLWIIGTEFNITSRMGLRIVGIVTEVAIFYYAEFAELEEAENALDRFITAGVNRLRPIAMTTFAAAFGHRHHRGLVAQCGRPGRSTGGALPA